MGANENEWQSWNYIQPHEKMKFIFDKAVKVEADSGF